MDIDPADLDEYLNTCHKQAVEEIVQILGRVTEGCINPDWARQLATNAVNGALINVEGK